MIRDTFDMFDPPDRGRFGDNETVRGNDSVRSDLVDIPCVLHVDTKRPGHEGAVYVSNNGEEARAEWIPNSRCQVGRTGSMVTGHRKNGQAVKLEQITLTLSEALAKEKGLI